MEATTVQKDETLDAHLATEAVYVDKHNILASAGSDTLQGQEAGGLQEVEVEEAAHRTGASPTEVGSTIQADDFDGKTVEYDRSICVGVEAPGARGRAEWRLLTKIVTVSFSQDFVLTAPDVTEASAQTENFKIPLEHVEREHSKNS